MDDNLYLRLIGIAAILFALITSSFLPFDFRVQLLSFPAIIAFIFIVLWDRTVFREGRRLVLRVAYAVCGAIGAALLFSLLFPGR